MGHLHSIELLAALLQLRCNQVIVWIAGQDGDVQQAMHRTKLVQR